MLTRKMPVVRNSFERPKIRDQVSQFVGRKDAIQALGHDREPARLQRFDVTEDRLLEDSDSTGARDNGMRCENLDAVFFVTAKITLIAG
jgi:hypothetical protein